MPDRRTLKRCKDHSFSTHAKFSKKLISVQFYVAFVNK